MKFSAALRIGSHVDRTWKAQRRFGGVLNGTTFRKVGNGFESTSDNLSADSVEQLKLHPDIELRVTGVGAEPNFNSSSKSGEVSPLTPVTPAADADAVAAEDVKTEVVESGGEAPPIIASTLEEVPST